LEGEETAKGKSDDDEDLYDGDKAVRVLVGNKIDIDPLLRRVSTEEASAFADQYGLGKNTIEHRIIPVPS
jgi:hypothetical protein